MKSGLTFGVWIRLKIQIFSAKQFNGLPAPACHRDLDAFYIFTSKEGEAIANELSPNTFSTMLRVDHEPTNILREEWNMQEQHVM